MDNLQFVAQTDPELAAVMQQELARQRNKIELIASENFTSLAVSGPKSFLVRRTPMCSPTVARRLTRRFTLPCCNRAIRCWV